MRSVSKILEVSFGFSISTIDLYKQRIEKKESILSRQLLPSVTSIGVTVEEAITGQSRKNFIFKRSFASRKVRKTRYGLCLLNKSNLIELDYLHYLNSSQHIITIPTRLVKKTAQFFARKFKTQH